MTESDACPHCEPRHGDPRTRPWGVYVGPERDGDGQPTTLHVMKSDGAHVAESDAQWLWRLIADQRSDSDPPAEEPKPPVPARTTGRLGRGG